MSDDENSEVNSRFNKFESSGRKRNLILKRSHSRESLSYNSKRPCSQFPGTSTQLNNTWTGSTLSISPNNNEGKYSANNRLKKLRSDLDKIKKVNQTGESVFHQLQDKNSNILENTTLQKNLNNSANNRLSLNRISGVNTSVNSTPSCSADKAFNVNYSVKSRPSFSVDKELGVNSTPSDDKGFGVNNSANRSPFPRNKVPDISDSGNSIPNFAVKELFDAQCQNINNKIPPTLTKTVEASSFSLESKNESNVNRPVISTPVNIYKNLDKWVPRSSDNKSSKRGLANERLQRLKKHVNNSDKDNLHHKNDCSVKSNTIVESQGSESVNNRLLNVVDISDENSHVSPLLRGVKRSANTDNIFECSTPKKIALDNTRPHSTQSRCIRLVQSVINSENNSTSIDDDKFLTPAPRRRSISVRVKVKVNSSTSASSQKEESMQSNKKGSKGSTSSSNSKSEEKTQSTSVQKDIEGDSYQAKMQMTANWIASHGNHLVGVTHYNPFSDEFKLVKSIQLQALSKESQVIKSDLNKTEPSSKEPQNEVEDMEWANAEPDEGSSKMSPETEQLHVEENGTTKVAQKDSNKSTNLCIVVDTNIFIKNLSKLKDILNMKITGPIQPILYIPWMVVTELDYIKDSCCSNDRLKKDVMNSVKFINAVLSEKNEKVVAQTIYDMQQQEQLGTSADDKIMSCCVFVQKIYESVILLSNDINLKNKALIHGIEVCSSNEIVMKIMSKLTRNVKFQKIHHKMSILCSSIICDCAKDTFGDAWKKMDMFSSPPWSLSECLKRFRKYWDTVFKDKLLKHFTKPLDETLMWLKNHKYISDDSKEYVKFVEFCITLCIHLRDIEECRGAVQNTLKEITKVG